MSGRTSVVFPPIETSIHRVSARLLLFVFDLLRYHRVDPRRLAAELPSIGGGDEVPPWVTWGDYIAMIDRLGDVDGPAGIAAAMRATLPTAYRELRALAGFFAGPIPFFSFVTHHLMRELVPGVHGRVEVYSDRDLRIRYHIDDALIGSRLYHHGTVTLLEVFPTHFGLPEARVEIVTMTDRACELAAEFPVGPGKVRWGEYLAAPVAPVAPVALIAVSSLTQREQEVLELVCKGFTNAEIATALGTAASTVKTQISSILTKMEVANRTELAALVAQGG